MSLIRRLPWWAWVALLVVVVVMVQEIRLRRAVAERDALHEQQFRAVIGAIQVQREELEGEKGVLTAERVQLKADLAQHKSRVAELERTRAAATVAVERAGQEAERLVTSGSMADVVAAWQALGWTLIPAPRPRP